MLIGSRAGSGTCVSPWIRNLGSTDPGREHARVYFVRIVLEVAENAATAFYCVYYGSRAVQRIVVRQSQPEGTVSFHHV